MPAAPKKRSRFTQHHFPNGRYRQRSFRPNARATKMKKRSRFEVYMQLPNRPNRPSPNLPTRRPKGPPTGPSAVTAPSAGQQRGEQRTAGNPGDRPLDPPMDRTTSPQRADCVRLPPTSAVPKSSALPKSSAVPKSSAALTARAKAPASAVRGTPSVEAAGPPVKAGAPARIRPAAHPRKATVFMNGIMAVILACSALSAGDAAPSAGDRVPLVGDRPPSARTAPARLHADRPVRMGGPTSTNGVDPQYRSSITRQNVACNQPAHTSFFTGAKMADPPRPRIRTVSAAARSEHQETQRDGLKATIGSGPVH